VISAPEERVASAEANTRAAFQGLPCFFIATRCPARRHARLRTTILAAGLALSTASQLRFGESPIGLGEVCLGLWITAVFVRTILNRMDRSWLWRYAIAFWVGSILLMCTGFLVGLTRGIVNPADAFHDAAALALCAGLFISLVGTASGQGDLHRVLPYLLLMTVVPLSALLLLAGDQARFGPLLLWLDGSVGGRFMAWAQNPNQIAIAICGLPFVALLLIARSRWWFLRVIYGLLGLSAIALGRATDSDALSVAWICGGIVGALSVLLRARARYRPLARAACMALAICTPVVILYFALAKPIDVQARIDFLLNKETQGGRGQGAVRFDLWANGLQAIAASPIVGFGPGSYSGSSGPFEGSEAHSTPIDWAMSSGVLGMMLLATLFYKAASQSYRSGVASLQALFCALFVFSAVHYVLRHPLFWMYLSVCMTHKAAPNALRN
jgi:O-antigen ligase